MGSAASTSRKVRRWMLSDFLVSNLHRSCLTCVCVTSTLVIVSTHCCSRRAGGSRRASTFIFSVKRIASSWVFSLLLMASVPFWLVRGRMVSWWLIPYFCLTNDHQVLFSTPGTHSLRRRSSSHFVWPICWLPSSFCRPMQVLVMLSRVLLIVNPRRVFDLSSNRATVVKLWLVCWSDGVLFLGSKFTKSCKNYLQ